MMIARGKKAIRPLLAGLCAAKRIAEAALLNIIAGYAPGNFPNYCRITYRKEILPLIYPRQDRPPFRSCATSWNERTAILLPMTRFQTRLKLGREPRQVPKRDSLSDCLHDVKKKVQVVVGVQDGAKDFVGSKQVAQIGTRIAAANHAATGVVDRPRITHKFRVLDVQRPVPRIEIPVACVARRQYAIHHVGATANVIDNLLRFAYSHEVTRTIGGQACCSFAGDVAGNFGRLADGQAADGIPGEFQRDQFRSIGATKLLKSSALHNGEENLPGVCLASRSCVDFFFGSKRPLE